MIALSDNPSIPRRGADDYCPENMSKKLLRSLYFIPGLNFQVGKPPLQSIPVLTLSLLRKPQNMILQFAIH